jgi:hypothetical protein
VRGRVSTSAGGPVSAAADADAGVRPGIGAGEVAGEQDCRQ